MLLPQLTGQPEHIFLEAIRDAAPVLSRPARSSAGMIGAVLANRNCAIPRRVAMRDGLLRHVLHHAEADDVVDLVHAGGVVGKLAGGPSFQHDNGQRAAGDDLLGHQQSGPAAAHNHEIHQLQTDHRERGV